MPIVDQTFEGVEVNAGADAYIRCTFRSCRMVVTGERFEFEHCRFNNVRWVFAGPAAGVLIILRIMHAAGGQMREAVERVMEGIRGDSGTATGGTGVDES